MYGAIGKEVGEILSTVCKITGVKLIKGGVCPNHVHLYVSIPLKMSVSDVMSKLKRKSALMIFDRHSEYRDKYGRHFWARGYYAETNKRRNDQEVYRRAGGM